MQKQMLCSYEKRHQKSEKEIEIKDPTDPTQGQSNTKVFDCLIQ
jgi:hypothetical protein